MDSIACRLKFLDDAAFNNTAQSCRYAGPSGGGRCGSLVKNVCRVAQNVCEGKAVASYAKVADCEDATTGLGSIAAHWGTKQGSDAAGDNSLECRVYHAIASLSTGADVHCSHYGASTVNATISPCSGPIPTTTAHYCDLLEFNCNNVNTQQYTDKAQCLAAAVHLPTSASDTAQASNGMNTLGCRVYHAQAANVLTVNHCGHAGPSGGGVCGTELQAWGSILNSTCQDSSVQDLVNTVSASVLNAAFPPGFRSSENTSLATYTSVLDQAGNTQACRIYHLGVAASAPSHCDHGDLSGANNCGLNFVDNLCLFIEQTCGFGSAAWQFDDAANCKADLTNSSTNVIQVAVGAYPDATANSYTCRFYHTSVAASFLTGGSNAATAGAVASKELHCGHVLKVPFSAGGCGTAAAPTPGTNGTAPTAGTNGTAPTARTNGTAPTSQPVTASALALSAVGSITAIVVGLFSL